MRVCGEEYWDLDNVIRKMILKCDDIKSIDLLINIDGLSLRKSSHATLWPILCSNMTDNTVYLVVELILDMKNLKILIFI